MLYLLDTNTVSYYFRREGDVAEKLLRQKPRDLAISTISEFELWYGLEHIGLPSRREQQLRVFLESVARLQYGSDEARAAARVRSALEKAGSPIGPFDTLIAGTALAHGAILVSHNVKEFGRVPGLEIEDWY